MRKLRKREEEVYTHSTRAEEGVTTHCPHPPLAIRAMFWITSRRTGS